MHVWIRLPGSCSTPVRRSRTCPSSRPTTQDWQIPIRQPNGIRTPAVSPASINGVAASRAAAHGQGGRVEFARSGKTVEVDAATPLMEAGEGAGVQMPFGCRMGICQSCVVGLLDGHVRDLRTGVEHDPGTRVQTCVSAASGDCTLDV